MKYAELVLCLQPHIATFAKTCDALDTVYTADKERYYGRVELHTAAVEFVFTKKERVLCPAHTLFCRIYPAKNDPRSYHLPELWDVLEQTDFPALYFPYIESEKRLKSCFDQLTGRLLALLPRIERLAERGDWLWTRCREQMLVLINEKPESIAEFDEEPEAYFWEFVRQWFENDFMCQHFTIFDGWRKYAEGDYAAALAAYAKLKERDRLPYDRALCDYMRAASTPVPAFAPNCDSYPLGKLGRGSGVDFGWMLLCWLAAYVLCAIPFVLLSVIVCKLYAGDALFAAAMPWYSGFLWAGLPALFGGLAFRGQLWRLLRRKNAKALLELEDIFNPRGTRAFSLICTIVTWLLGVVGTVLVGGMGVWFYEGHLIEASENPFDRVEYAYADITDIYHVQGLTNDVGEYIDRDFYVLKFVDGSFVNLDGSASAKEIEEYALPLLKDYALPVQEVALPEDIGLNEDGVPITY